jgi:hypothetical protein
MSEVGSWELGVQPPVGGKLSFTQPETGKRIRRESKLSAKVKPGSVIINKQF